MGDSAAASSLERSLALDVLRGIAIITVLGRHLPEVPAAESATIRFVFNLWYQMGWIGVDLFFVLSGFLVSGLIFREYQLRGEFRAGHFLVRRGFKIYPLFYFTLAASLYLFKWLAVPIDMNRILAEVFFLQNYLPNFLIVTWSLAIEEHFYLLLALLLVVLMRKKEKPLAALPWVCGFVCVAALVLRIWTLTAVKPFDYAVHFMPTHLRIDSLMFGVLISYCHHLHPAALKVHWNKYQSVVLPVACLCVLPPFFMQMEGSFFILSIGFTLLYLGFGAMMTYAVLRWPNERFRGLPAVTRVVGFLGTHSYSIYLWHVVVFTVVVVYLPNFFNRPFSFTESVVLCLLIALPWSILMSVTVERLSLKLRERLFPSRAKPVAAMEDGISAQSSRSQ